MSWGWVAAQLEGMVADEFKQLNTNRPHDVAQPRTRAEFDAANHFASDGAVLAAVQAASTGLYAFSGSD